MKGLLCFSCLAVAAAASAQSTPRAAEPKGPVLPNIGTLAPQPPQHNPTETYVYTLPQDGMPCLIPTTKDLAPMPNALPVVTPPAAAIPNPGKDMKLRIQPEPK